MAKVGYDGWIVVESGGGDSLVPAGEDLVYLKELVENWLPLVRG